MTAIRCSRCGYADVAVVRKEVIGGKHKKTFLCPRCSNTWELKD